MIAHCSIRNLDTNDLPRLHEIREAAFEPVFASFRRIVGEKIATIALESAEREQAEHLDRICAADASHDVFVVECGSSLVAFCAVSCNRDSKVGEIDLNAVHPDHQGKGIGSWMYRVALDRMRAAGMRAATVGTGGDPSHAPARRAYENAGFGPAIPSLYYYTAL
ncbi:MAG: GNAT family N-acetyltransferase [Pseudomonadota bacterium]